MREVRRSKLSRSEGTSYATAEFKLYHERQKNNFAICHYRATSISTTEYSSCSQKKERGFSSWENSIFFSMNIINTNREREFPIIIPTLSLPGKFEAWMLEINGACHCCLSHCGWQTEGRLAIKKKKWEESWLIIFQDFRKEWQIFFIHSTNIACLNTLSSVL